ncbi:MAG TPA: hypothetical protein VFT37_07900 [Telluria sp.]|nr:hypothetical protein [Telluria sp.]
MKKLIILTAVMACAGCSTTPNYDARFGDAVRDARLAQTINPNAGSNPDQVSGLDGPAAREAMGRYLQTFKEPPPVVNVINIGGAIGSK